MKPRQISAFTFGRSQRRLWLHGSEGNQVPRPTSPIPKKKGENPKVSTPVDKREKQPTKQKNKPSTVDLTNDDETCNGVSTRGGGRGADEGGRGRGRGRGGGRVGVGGGGGRGRGRVGGGRGTGGGRGKGRDKEGNKEVLQAMAISNDEVEIAKARAETAKAEAETAKAIADTAKANAESAKANALADSAARAKDQFQQQSQLPQSQPQTTSINSDQAELAMKLFGFAANLTQETQSGILSGIAGIMPQQQPFSHVPYSYMQPMFMPPSSYMPYMPHMQPAWMQQPGMQPGGMQPGMHPPPGMQPGMQPAGPGMLPVMLQPPPPPGMTGTGMRPELQPGQQR